MLVRYAIALRRNKIKSIGNPDRLPHGFSFVSPFQKNLKDFSDLFWGMNNRKNQEIFSEEEQLRNEQAVQALIELPTVKLIATSDNEAT